MNYALLAATALGAIGLYLMLPRGKATLARLGLLLGGMALVGLFLYLLRTVAEQHLVEVGGPPIYFYLFGLIMIGGAVGVVTQPKPVYAALYFVLITLAGAGMFVLLLAEFMAIVLVIIYAGAILVTYVFVIMLASQGQGKVEAAEYDRRASEPFFATLAAFLLIGAVLQALFPVGGKVIAEENLGGHDRLMALNLGVIEGVSGGAGGGSGGVTGVKEGPATMPKGREASVLNPPSGIQVVGVNLYSKYALSLELAGILLTIALVGAVVIARKGEGAHVLGSGELPTE